MKYTYIAISIVALGLSLFFTDASSQTRTNISHTMPEHATFSPTPYTLGSNLPPNYKGLNVKKLWTFLQSKQKSLKNGEYETSASYEKRIAQSANGMDPLLPGKNYALLLTRMNPKYDADTQTYTMWSPGFCQKTSSVGESKGWVTCYIADVQRSNSSYVGSNAFGATASVDQMTGTDFAVAVRDDSLFLLSSIFNHDALNQFSDQLDIKTGFSYPVDKARALRNDTIGVLLVGTFDSDMLIEGPARSNTPTIDDPRNMYIAQDAVPFTPAAIVYYVEQTGMVLATTKL